MDVRCATTNRKVTSSAKGARPGGLAKSVRTKVAGHSQQRGNPQRSRIGTRNFRDLPEAQQAEESRRTF